MGLPIHIMYRDHSTEYLDIEVKAFGGEDKMHAPTGHTRTSSYFQVNVSYASSDFPGEGFQIGTCHISALFSGHALPCGS